MKKVLLAWFAALALTATADAANIPLQTGPNDPALNMYYNNQKIQAFNFGSDGLLASLPAAVTTTGTSAFTLMSYTLPGGQLNINGQALHIHAWGTNSADANVKTLTFNYGAASCAQIVTGSGNAWVADFYVLKTGATTQSYECHSVTGTTAVVSTQNTATNTDASAATVTVQGTAATSGTMTLAGAYVEQLK